MDEGKLDFWPLARLKANAIKAALQNVLRN
jgi:hypothetical protein